MSLRVLLTACLTLLPGVAHAEWRWAPWGASPEQMISASGGKARGLNDLEREFAPQEWGHLGIVAELKSVHLAGYADFDVYFMFDEATRRLICAKLIPRTDVIPSQIKDHIVDVYGRPAGEAQAWSKSGMSTIVWMSMQDMVYLRYGAAGASAVYCARDAVALRADH